jgi:hypothetical protein
VQSVLSARAGVGPGPARAVPSLLRQQRTQAGALGLADQC